MHAHILMKVMEPVAQHGCQCIACMVLLLLWVWQMTTHGLMAIDGDTAMLFFL